MTSKRPNRIPFKFLAALFVPTSLILAQTGALAPVPLQQPLGSSGQILGGSCLYTFLAGTTTPEATYSDSALGTPNTNPVVLSSAGRAPALYLSPVAYKFVFGQKSVMNMCPASPGTVIWSQDNVYDVGELLRAVLAGSTGIYTGFILDTGTLSPDTLAAHCTNAVGLGKPLAITRAWTALPTQTICPHLFLGGTLQPASGQTITDQTQVCPEAVRCYDRSAGGSFVFPANATVTPNNFGAVADGAGSTGTDNSVAVQYAIDSTSSLLILNAAKCIWAQSITLHSNLTIYGESPSACIQKPAGSTVTQVLTTGGAAAFSNIHLRNFTCDGNRANQTGISPTNPGVDCIFFGGASDSSVEDVNIIHSFTDGVDVDGYGTSAVTATVSATEVTKTIDTCSWSAAGVQGAYATCHTTAANNFVVNTITTISGVNPAGYNNSGTPVAVIPVDSTHFQYLLASNPGAYVSGGATTTSTVTRVSGANFSQIGPGAPLTIGNTTCTVQNTLSPTVLYCFQDQGTQANVALTGAAYAGLGNNVLLKNLTISDSGRNSVSLLAGTNTVISGGRYTTPGQLQAPRANIDVEPYQLGAFLNGLVIKDVELDHGAFGILLIPKITFDANLSPIISNVRAHDNATNNLNANNSFTTYGNLSVSGNFDNGGTGTTCVLLSWHQATVSIPWIESQGCNGSGGVALFNQAVGGQVVIASGQLNGDTQANGGFDIGSGYIGNLFSPVINGAALVNGTILGIVSAPLNGQLGMFGINCIPVWDNLGLAPRLGELACNGQIFSVGGPGTSTGPGIGVATDGSTHIGKLEWDANTGTFVVASQTADPICLIGGDHDTKGVCVDGSGNIYLPSVPTSASGLTAGYIWSNAGVLTRVP